MNYRFHPDAEAEFVEAIEYYEEKERGLGLDFAAEVHSGIERALAFPNAWPVVEADVRRCLVRRSPTGYSTQLKQTKSTFWRSCICTEVPNTGNTESEGKANGETQVVKKVDTG